MATAIAAFSSKQKVGFAANVDELITPPLPVHLRQRRDPEQGYYPAVPECPVPWRQVVQ